MAPKAPPANPNSTAEMWRNNGYPDRAATALKSMSDALGGRSPSRSRTKGNPFSVGGAPMGEDEKNLITALDLLPAAAGFTDRFHPDGLTKGDNEFLKTIGGVQAIPLIPGFLSAIEDMSKRDYTRYQRYEVAMQTLGIPNPLDDQTVIDGGGKAKPSNVPAGKVSMTLLGAGSPK